jgi:serine/threonine-protein kinase
MARVILATLRGAGGFEKRLVVKQIRDELAMDQAFVARLVEEAKTTVALSHPNIVPVYELGVEQGTYYIAMELVVGVSIAEIVGTGQAKRPMSPEEGAYVGIEVCRALDYAHRRMDVVHRDITPRNVMVDEEGQVKLIDFGIAAPSAAGKVEVFGSPGHMPPEQMRGEKLGPATDIFAVAVLLMEAWTGVAPFRRTSITDVEAALKDRHPKPSDFEERLAPLDDIMLACMSLDPKDRPQSAEDLGKALRKFASGTDLGDVARELGGRVKRRRALMKPTPLEPSARKPMPSQGELVTKTFAAREEVEKWKSEAPPPLEVTGPSTRKLEEEKETKIETIATRPLETPVDPQTVRRPRPGFPRWLMGVVGIAAIGGGAVIWKTRTTPGTTPVPSAPVSVTAPVSATAPASVSATVTVPVSATVTAPVSATASESARGHFALYGDPGTKVAIDGIPRGSVPIADLAIEPGEHDIKFTFNATGETAEKKRILLKAGERIRVKAEFTGASPQIVIQR